MRLLDNKFLKESYNRLKYKGTRNKNNPVNSLRRASELVVIKEPNYTDLLSCHFCISDNKYKVYVQREEPSAYGLMAEET